MARLNKLGDFALRLESFLSAFLPSAPGSLVAAGGDGVATLSWTPSAALLQLPVTDYQAQVSADGTTWSDFSDSVGTSTAMTVTGLTNGNSYFFRVRAINRVGNGPFSAATAAVMVGLPPSPPTSVTAVAGERSVSLSWSAPANTGGLPVTDYAIERSEDSGVTWVAVARSPSVTTSHTVTGLLGQVAYQFRVRAVTLVGPGEWSSPVSATPLSFDDYWADVALLLKMEGTGTLFTDSSANNTAITSVGLSQSTTQKRWGAKSADFSSSSTYLTVANGASTSLAGAFTIEMWVYWKTAPTREVYLFHGANNSTEGRNMGFLVTTTNGQGLRYGRSYRGYLTSPAPVTFAAGRWYHIAVVREADFRIRLFVDGVQINTDMPVDLWSGSGSLSGRMFVGYPARSPSAFVDEFRVTKRARYSSNFTPPGEPFPAASRPQAPSAPASVTLTPGEGSLTASWPAVTGATGYVVEYQQDGGEWVAAATVTATTATVSGLNYGETYTVRVAGTNNVAGQGNWATSPPITLLVPPGQVTGLTAIGGHQQACLSWTAPDGDIADYTVQYNGGAGWLTFAHAPSANPFISVTGLTNGVSYSFRVAATNSQSSGANSATATATPVLVLPAAPTAVSGVSGSGQVSLTWTPPSETVCSALTSYIISYSADSGATWTSLAPQPTTGNSYIVGGLQNGTGYVFRVAYQSSAGIGPWSDASATVTPVGLPSPPVSVVGTAGDGQVVVTWIAGGNGGSPVTDYLLQYSVNQSVWTQVDDGQNTATSYTVTGLTNGTTYFFRVSTRTTAGDSGPTQSAPVTPAGLPTAPGTPSGTASPGQVSLMWEASSANGSAIVGYQVEYTTGGVSQTVSTGSPNASAIVSSLTNGLSYTFRVRAVNGVGNGGWSAASSPILVQGTPSAPTALTGTIGDGIVALTWSAPSDTGGSAVTEYTVEYTPSGGSPLTATATSSPYTLPGLTNGTTYSIRVAANNSIGRGAYSTAITRTPATTPGVPTGLTATGGSASGRLALAWTAPASNGGSAITDYVVEYTPSGGSPLTVSAASNATTYNLDGLTDGTSYSVRVRAVNAIGAGSYSSAATATPGLVPGAPTALAGTIGNNSVALTWTAPSYTGGVAITNYTVEYTPSGGSPLTATAASSPYTLTGLTNGTAYSIRVAANNSIGRGAYTAAITRTPATTPGVPTGFTATRGSVSGRLALAWTAPASNGGAAITSYTVEYTPSGGSPLTVSTGAVTSYNLDGLTDGTSYSVRIRAVNAIGAGSYTSSATATPGTVPGTPTSLTGTIGDSSVALTWDAPASTGGFAITNYTVEYTPEGGSPLTATAASSPYTLSGLTNGTTYSIRVAANNSVGRGAYTAAITRTPVTTPAAPTGLTATGGSASGRLVLSWTAPNNGGATITNYTVEYTASGGSPLTVSTNSSATTYNLDGLTNGTSYSVRVRAVNSAGFGGYSTQAIAAPGTAPGAPTALGGDTASQRVNLFWTAPASDGGFAITDYTVEYTPDGGSPLTATAASSPYSLTGLTNGTTYSIRVAANNSIGRGAYSAAISRTPNPITIPPMTSSTAPSGVASAVALGNSASIAYEPYYAFDGDNSTYVQLSPGNHGVYLQYAFPDGVEPEVAGYSLRNFGTYSAPSDWDFLGSYDGVTWTTIHQKRGQASLWGNSPENASDHVRTVNFTLDLPVQYRMFRWEIPAFKASANLAAVQIIPPLTPGVPPGAPTALTGTAGNGSVALTWTAPARTGGHAITNYTVEYTPDGGSPLTATAASSPYTLPGLTNGTVYSIRVAANNSVGRGAYSTAITRTPDAIRLIPTMTSNTAPSGVASAAALGGTASVQNEPYYAFDGDDSTFVGLNSSNDGVYLQYAFPVGVEPVVAGYSLRHNGGAYSAPNSWDFLGSNDGVNWTTIHQQRNKSGLFASDPNMTWADPAKTVNFTLTSPVQYRMFRWHVIAFYNSGPELRAVQLTPP